MPYPNVHAGRIKDKGLFLKDPWATITIKPGIQLILGKLKKDGPSGPTTGQSYHFDRTKFTAQQAKDWLKKHKIKVISFEGATGKGQVKEVIDVLETTIAAMIAPRFEKCFSKGVQKKKKIQEQGKLVASASNLTNDEMKGSFEEVRAQIRKAVEDSGQYGKYPYVMATFDDHVFVNSDGGPGEPSRYYRLEYSIKDDKVQLGTATELEKVTKYVIKEWEAQLRKDVLEGLNEGTPDETKGKEKPKEKAGKKTGGMKGESLGIQIAREVLSGLLEGGAGSGNWGHGGRPGHKGGSVPGGGKGSMTTGKGWGELPQAKAMTGYEKKFWDKFAKEHGGTTGGGGAGKFNAASHVKNGKIDMKSYKTLGDAEKTKVLEHAIGQHKDHYVPKAQWGDKANDANWVALNKKVGELEGMVRAYTNKAKGLTQASKEHRGALHVIASLRERVTSMASGLGSKGVANVKQGTTTAVGGVAAATKSAAAPK